MAGENLRCDVVRCTNGGVCHESSRPAPVVDLRTVADCEVDLIDGDGAAIPRTVGFPLEQLLIVIVIVQLVETGGQTEIGQLHVATTVQEDVVGLYITVTLSAGRFAQSARRPGEGLANRWMKPSL